MSPKGLSLSLTFEAVRWLVLLGLVIYALRRRSLTVWILVAIVLGAEVGNDFPKFAVNLRLLSQIFLQMIRVIVAPLLFSTLVSGIAAHSDLKKIGRMGLKAILYFEILTTIALFIGLGAINLSKAGVGVKIPAAPGVSMPTAKPTASEIILNIFPENIAKSVANNQVLQVVVFSMIFGIALAMVGAAKRKPMLDFTESLAAVMFKFTDIVMLFAPIGIGGAIAYTVASTGFGVLYNLGKLLLTLYVALLIFALIALLPSALISKIPIPSFLRAITEPATIAFSTSSSEAALPSAMEAMEAFGVPRQIVAFVIPLGYSFNLTGSTLYLSLASVFVAQAAGIHLSAGQQFVMMLMLMVSSKGVAGVSRAAIIILLGAADQFGLPKEPVLILLGVDQFMDMGRTTMNVVGNCLASAVIARWEGDFPSTEASLPAEESLAK
jgi:proton glutamate symport protein